MSSNRYRKSSVTSSLLKSGSLTNKTTSSLGRDYQQRKGSVSANSFSTEMLPVPQQVRSGNGSSGRSSPRAPAHGSSPHQVGLEDHGSGSGDIISSSQHSDRYMDDSLQPGWETFTNLAVRGKVDLTMLVQFVNEMGIECDQRLVRKAMRQENMEWSKGIEFENAMKLVDIIPMIISDDMSVSNTSTQGNVKYLTPMEYFKRKMGTEEAKKDKKERRESDSDTEGEEVVYRLRLCSISPRTRILLITVIIFFLVAGAIVTLMTLLWMRASFDRVEHRILALTSTLSHLSETTVDLSIASVSESVGSQVSFFTTYIENEWIRLQNSTTARVNSSAVEMATIITIMGTGILKQRGESLDARMNLFVDLMESPNYIPEVGATIRNQLQRWALREAKEYVIIDGTTGAWIDGTVSLTKFQAASCYAPMQAGQRIGSIIAAPVDLEGVSGSHTSFCVTPKMNLCITVGVKANTHLIRLRAIELLTESNQKSNGKFIQSNLDKANHGTVAAPAEFLLWYPDESEVDGLVRRRNPSSSTDEFCQLSINQQVCSQLQLAVDSCWASKCSVTNMFIPYIDGLMVYAAIVYVARANAVLTLAVRHETIKEMHQVAVVRAINSVNAAATIPVELFLSVVNKAQEVVPDVTESLKTCSFGDECLRVDEVEETFRNSIVYPGTLYSKEYVNYVLSPVIGSTLAVEGGLNSALTIEMGSEYVRSTMVDRLAHKYDDINDIWPSTLEVMFYKRRDTPTSPIFDPNDPCPTDVLCTTSDTYGVLTRDDCTNCVRYVTPILSNRSPVTYLTKFKTAADGLIEGQLVQPNINDDFAMTIVDTPDSNYFAIATGDSYAGKPSRAVSSLFSFFRGYITVYEEESASLDTIYLAVAITAGVSCGVVLIGIGMLVWLSRRTLQKVENEWLNFKEGIDEEKAKFKSMIREIVPTKTFDRYTRGQKAVAETHQMLSFAFVDVSSFAEKQKSMSPREVVRTLAYHATLYNTVAGKYNLFRLRSFGDTSIYIGGLNGDEPPSVTAFSTASFASTVVQLLSPMFSHYPQKMPQLADTFKGDEKLARVSHPVLPVRIGLHCGPAVSSLIDFGRTPNYDIHGPSLSLARRMQVTATVGRVNCSTSFKELLEAGDLSGQFEFDQIRKLVVKGLGTVSTFPLKSMAIRVEDTLLNSLYIEYAVSMFDFRPLSSQVKGATGSNTKSQSQSSSHMSQMTGDSAASSMLGDQIFAASTNPPSVTNTENGM